MTPIALFQKTFRVRAVWEFPKPLWVVALGPSQIHTFNLVAAQKWLDDTIFFCLGGHKLEMGENGQNGSKNELQSSNFHSKNYSNQVKKFFFGFSSENLYIC